VDYDVASHALAFAAAVRSFAPDVWFLVRRLLGAGVRIGAATLSEQQPPSPAQSSRPGPPGEGGRR
jgi:hypothetical protein